MQSSEFFRYCRHHECGARAKSVTFLDYHDGGGPGGSWFRGFTPQRWCSLECIVSDMLHAIENEDMEALQRIRSLIVSGEEEEIVGSLIESTEPITADDDPTEDL